MENKDIWVTEMYSDHVIYEVEIVGQESQLYKRSYALDSNENVTLMDDVVQVERLVSFVPVQNTKGNSMERKDAIAVLLKNSKFEEKDIEFLTSLEDAQFEAVQNAALKEEESSNAPQEDGKTTEETTVQNSVKPVTFQELLAAADPATQQLIQNGLAKMAQERAELVSKIVANASNQFEESFLQTQDVDFLQKLVGSISVQNADTGPASFAFVGQGGSVVSNSGVAVTPLGMPSSE